MSEMSKQNFKMCHISYLISFFTFINGIMYFFSLKGGCHDSLVTTFVLVTVS